MWIEGTVDGVYRRQSLKIPSWERAEQLRLEMEEGKAVEPISVAQAMEVFLADQQARALAESTLLKLKTLMSAFQKFCAETHIGKIAQVDIARVRQFRASWRDSPISAVKKLERLRSFFSFCVASGWLKDNPAKPLKNPIVTDPPTLPFIDTEVERILKHATGKWRVLILLLLRGQISRAIPFISFRAYDGHQRATLRGNVSWTPIKKDVSSWPVQPNMPDLERTRTAFSWDQIRRELSSSADNFNIAGFAVDRHAAGPLHDRIALRWLGRDGAILDTTYAQLRDQTNRFANVLRGLGVGKEDRVFVLAGRIPALYTAALGTLKTTGVFCPLFSAFGPEPVRQRLQRGNAKVLLTTERLYRKTIAGLRDTLPELKHILIADARQNLDSNVWALEPLLAQASSDFSIPRTVPGDMALLHFTSGTTGMPKGAIHVHEAALMHYMTSKFALDLHPEDVFWCTADPGWVTGTSYGIIAPLLHGVTNLVDEGDFDAERWYGILEKQKVAVWYTAPTAIRMLMRIPGEPRSRFDLSHLRLIASVGEPLNPSAVVWGQQALGLPIHDNWWQTETGGIMISNYPSMEIRPGSMGKPLPGVEAGIVEPFSDGRVRVLEQLDREGELVLKPGWPSMFRGYLHEPERYQKCFAKGDSGEDWYLTGDLARRDADGYYTFVGRADDIIKTAGHMVGPFEVESALLEHPAVAEAGVIGKPDPVIGEIVKAFVALKPGHTPGEELKLELLGFARKKLGAAVSPKEIAFCAHLPRTRSGKIMRRLLKARELGLPEGDLSTLEGSA